MAILVLASQFIHAQQTVARQWMEVLLESIRNDFARPTVHARNLFHISAAMYDSWAVYEKGPDTYFLGKTHDDFFIPFERIVSPNNILKAQEEAMSYACYRLIQHRFRYSPGADASLSRATDLMVRLGHDVNYSSINYQSESPAALGNYLAEKIIDFGLQDGSNEATDYINIAYLPVNDPLLIRESGNPNMTDPDRWQPLAFETFIDQSGNEVAAGTPEFLGAEWVNVTPFSLTLSDLTIHENDEGLSKVYLDPGPPVYLTAESPEDYKWGFGLVSIWSSHLDSSNPREIDISPAATGNLALDDLPKNHAQLPDFYTRLGADMGNGYEINPYTGMAYENQSVLVGDFARVLAEFWADGPDSETPPGHWFTILNYVNDHPQLEKRFKGKGEIVDDLEWDVKGYFMLGGAMHDAAISAWSVKGCYDYVRPISAIRYMADKGQSSDESLPNYHVEGILLEEGYIELVKDGDPLIGENLENLDKIKLYAWQGHDFIFDPEEDVSGVGWILAEDWFPYQRISFVTPPFAGYVSGHSTFSRAAAHVLSVFTGDEFFPGGMGEFEAKQNEFLVFEEGPTEDIILQWAKYYDAADQCSLSRIWGGIHPPVDDINGRFIGQEVGEKAVELAENYFSGSIILDVGIDDTDLEIFPNPTEGEITIRIAETVSYTELIILDQTGRNVWNLPKTETEGVRISIRDFPAGIYYLILSSESSETVKRIIKK